MSVALLVITDGRDEYLADCVASAEANLHGPVTERWMYDDTGDQAHRLALAARYPEFRHINNGPRQGFGGAIRAAWAQLAERSRADWVFHLEADFTFNRPVDLAAMVDVLANHWYLAQMALLRQPWNAAEHAAGGIINQHPGDYSDVTDGRHHWLEHRRFFTTNPSLYRRSLCSRGWPAGRGSEGRFGLALFAESLLNRCGFWGRRTDPPWVEHIGHQRVGTGY